MRLRLVTAVMFMSVLGAMSGASATHASGQFVQPVWFQWTQANLDVLIVPPNHGQIRNGNGALNGGDANELNPYANSYLRATEHSVADFDRAVAAHAEPWLAAGLVTNVYVVGRDAIPDSALKNPEIVIFTDETKGPVLGIAVNTRPCLVDNSKLLTGSFSYEDMFNINAQEYGHCLGLQHVPGDAKGTKAKDYTDGDLHDPLNGLYPDALGAADGHLHCVSNLNVAGIQEVFRRTLTGVPGAVDARIDVTAYVRPATCGPGA